MSEIKSAQVFKHSKAKKNVIYGGAVILACITLLSCFSSFMIYREGFTDMPGLFQNGLAFFAVIVVEGAFVWLVYGFTRAFSSFWERAISFATLWALAAVMLTNIITHFMLVKGLELHPFQQAWLAWGAVSVFIGVLVVVLAITLADPVIRLIRTELRYLGKQEETILQAKTEALEGERILQAMAQRAEWESEQLAARIMGQSMPLPAPTPVIRGFGPASAAPGYAPKAPQPKTILVEFKTGHQQYLEIPSDPAEIAQFFAGLQADGAKVVVPPPKQ